MIETEEESSDLDSSLKIEYGIRSYVVSDGGAVSRTNVINLKRPLNGKQNVWKYQNGEEKSDSDGREKDV